MASDRERATDEGLAIQELKRSEGWPIIESKIKEETQSAVEDLRRISLDGRSLGEVGSEYIALIQKINGLERVLEIVREIEERYQEAQK